MNLSVLSYQKDLDCTLVSKSGEMLGEIEDWVIDQRNGEIVAGVAGIGGFLGVGERKILLPENILRFEPARDRYHLMANESLLDQAPHFSYTDSGHFDAALLEKSRSYFNKL